MEDLETRALTRLKDDPAMTLKVMAVADPVVAEWLEKLVQGATTKGHDTTAASLARIEEGLDRLLEHAGLRKPDDVYWKNRPKFPLFKDRSKGPVRISTNNLR